MPSDNALRTRPAQRFAAGGLLLVLLAACGAPRTLAEVPPQGDLHGSEVGDVIARPLLVGRTTEGRPFSLADRPDDLTLVFFGYTHCPDVCPTTMADLAAAERRLPDGVRSRVHVVFVTQDPARDTPARLRTWLDQFDPSFTGVVGVSAADSDRVLTQLKAPRTEPSATEGELEHAGSVYAFRGTRTVVYTGGTTPREYAEDVRALLSSG